MITYNQKINKLKRYVDNIPVSTSENISEISLNNEIINSLDVTSDNILKPDNSELNEIQSVKNEILSVSESSKNTSNINTSADSAISNKIDISSEGPWDKRIYRGHYIGSNNTIADIVPYDAERGKGTATSGYYMSKSTFDGLSPETKAEMTLNGSYEETIGQKIEQMKTEDLYAGVKSVVNNYSLVTLYGSKGGKHLVDKKNRRAWYEVDHTNMEYGFSKIPTTQSIISWGNGDPYERTPYKYSDFVFCKYWNVIPNNRLITLRRFSAPIVDNMNFPGMDGSSESGDSNPHTGNITFAPMATAVTYFGEETGNKLSEILKFKTGMPWGKAEGDVFKVDIEGGAAGSDNIQDTVFTQSSILKHLNIHSGNWNFNSAINKGMPPPDPWNDGPYTNRILGPLNRINEVAKRDPGIVFEHNGLSLTFEYKARPIGGINSKAILLDILSNFFVIGSMSAMFFGGMHRFMAAPAAYPFMGGADGISAWYNGDPERFLKATAGAFMTAGQDVGSSIKDIMSKILNAAKNFSFSNMAESFSNLTSSLGEGQSGKFFTNSAKGWMAARNTKGIPYLKGLRSLLTGEPVGEWHLTIGNPLNPIALIGNLICENIEVEFGDELGPDDFPLDLKIKVNLKHGMARDRDALEAMFNRGMGRIYSLPDEFTGTADFQTKVDDATQGDKVSSNSGEIYHGQIPFATTGHTAGSKSNVRVQKIDHHSPSVWNRLEYYTAGSTETSNFNIPDMANRSITRTPAWIAVSALK